MTHNQDPFEDSLRRRLSRLAERAPAGPTAEKIVEKLGRRTRHRRRVVSLAACSAALAAAILCAVTIRRLTPSRAIAPGGQGGPVPIASAKALTDDEIREAVGREVQAARLVASSAILAQAPGSQDDVRIMRRFVLSQYGNTNAARTLEPSTH